MNTDIQAVIQKIDLRLPGAVEALEAAQRSGAELAEFRRIADEFPLRFHGGVNPVTESAHAAAVQRLRAMVKSPDKATVAIRSGAEVRFGAPARLSFNNANMNWVSNGGLPRTRVTEIKGPPGYCKSAALLQAAAHCVALGGKVLWVAVEPFDADWARTNGVPVHYAPEEAPPGSEEEAFNLAHPEGLGFDVLVGRTGNELLQQVVNAVGINAWDMVAVDSLNPATMAKHLETKTVGDYIQGGEAIMHNQFSARVQTEFNGVEAFVGRAVAKHVICKSCGQVFGAQKDHDVCETQEAEAEATWAAAVAAEEAKAKETGKKAKVLKRPATRKPKFEESVTYGLAPRTAVPVVMQLRAVGIGSNSHQPLPPNSAGGLGFHHAKSLSLMFSGKTLLRVDTKEGTTVYGCIVEVTGDKSKVGPEQRRGVVEFWTSTVPGVSEAGRYNKMTDLVGATVTFGDNEKVFPGLALRAGLIQQSGAWFEVGGHKFQGRNQLQKFLGENPSVLRALDIDMDRFVMGGG
jgi:hypothetical protein